MHTGSSIMPLAAVPGIAGDELAEGLMLVRATSLKLIRLQLAMERQDRRVALEAVDDLVALDRHLEQYVASLPAFRDQALFGEALDAERSALNREKLTLAAGVHNRREADEGPAAPAPEPIQSEAASGAIASEPPLEEWEPAEGYVPQSGRWWLLGILLLVLALAGAAYWLGADALPDWPAIGGLQ